jgi:hypothetical protein
MNSPRWTSIPTTHKLLVLAMFANREIRSMVAFWFLEYCISACCPIDTLPRINDTRSSMLPLP